MRRYLKYAVVLPILMLFGLSGEARQEAPPDKTLSPYFFVKSDDPATDQLPLKSTSAAVGISGVIADVKVTQVYKNEGKRPLEAIYVFPASTRAAVYGMKMTVGERVIVAGIKRRDEARQDYERARQAGQSASLLEQQRPNVFQMNVANIMPGDTIKVELRYTELLAPEDRIYEFVYPAVVGPRYSNQPAETATAQDNWVANPYLRQGEAPTYAFDIAVNLAAGLPLKDIHCRSHKVNISYGSASSATIKLDPSETGGGNRDYVLRYRLDGDKVQSGLLLSEGKDENYFLLMVQPPKRVAPAQIPDREYIFIVDVSGSMHGYPIEISKKLLKDLIGRLRPTDTFNLLLFAGGNSVMAERSLPATAENVSKAVQLIDRQHGGGATELLPALRRALSLPRTEAYSRTVVIATDGYVSVEAEAFDLIRTNLGNANMFTFGIGTSVNRHLIEGMARSGMGEPFVITMESEATAAAERFRAMVQSPVLTRIKLDFGSLDVYDVEPLSIPDVMADRPVIVFGKWRGKPQGSITVKGITGGGEYSETIKVASVAPDKAGEALKYLWARHRIATLSDYNLLRADDKRIREVTELGLKYNLLTAYTSFVAVDTEVRNRDGRPTTVTQPLPLPEGVSDHAVGGIAAYKSVMPAAAPWGGSVASRREMADHRTVKEKQAPVHVPGVKVETQDADLRRNMENELRKRLSELSACNPANFHSELTVSVTIDTAGNVTGAKIVSGKPSDKKLEQCIIDAIRKMRFSSGAVKVEATAKIKLRF